MVELVVRPELLVHGSNLGVEIRFPDSNTGSTVLSISCLLPRLENTTTETVSKAGKHNLVVLSGRAVGRLQLSLLDYPSILI